MNIKTWQERDIADPWLPSDKAMQAEIDELRVALEFETACYKTADRIAKKALAEFASIKRQEPVEFQFQDKAGKWYPFMDQRHYENTVADGRWPTRSLFLAAGAQTAQAQERKPLTLGQIDKLMSVADQYWSSVDVPLQWAEHFVRAIEAKIKEQP